MFLVEGQNGRLDRHLVGKGTPVFVAYESPAPPPESALRQLEQTSVSTLGHLTDFGFPEGLNPLFRPLKFVGPAVTVRIPHIDHTAVHVALDYLRAGDVLVVDQSGDDSRSCFGGMASYAARCRKAAGAILSGPANDVTEIEELGFPVFSSGIAAHTTRLLGLEGAINVPVVIGGSVVQPGDVIFADSDGIAVLAQDQVGAVGSLLADKEAAEPAQKRSLDAGGSLAELSGARALFNRA